jgi:asparagine synthase (glutamine-hydrolysing)
MGSVFGIVGSDTDHQLEKMSIAVDHRGVNQFLSADEGFSLGQRSPEHKSRDCLYRANGREITVLFDGDIINRHELRDRLAAAGTKVDPTKTTDLLAALYLQYGEKFPQYIAGGFAVALRDGAKLLLARDPMGVKPLFYHRNENRLVFSSQIKSLKRGLAQALRINWEVLFERYIFGDHILGDSTYFTGMKQVKPGHVVVVESHPASLTTFDSEYGQITQGLPSADSEEYKQQVAALVERNVKYYIENCGSVGILLSGGFDSSILAALAAKHSSSRLKTFTISDDPNFPDILAARRVAEHLDTEHHEFIVDKQTFRKDLIDGIYAYEDLIYRDTIFMLARSMVPSVDSVLSGACADVFGLPVLMRSDPNRRRQLWQRLLNLTGGKAKDYPIAKYMEWFLPGLSNQLEETAFAHFLNDYIPNQIFPSTERAFSFCGMEACFPYADPKLHALARKLPHEMRMVDDREKPVLRDAFSDLDLPEEILRRPTYCSKHNLQKSKADLRSEWSSEELNADMDPRLRRLFPDTYTANCFYLFQRLFTEVDTSPDTLLAQMRG